MNNYLGKEFHRKAAMDVSKEQKQASQLLKQSTRGESLQEWFNREKKKPAPKVEDAYETPYKGTGKPNFYETPYKGTGKPNFKVTVTNENGETTVSYTKNRDWAERQVGSAKAHGWKAHMEEIKQ